MRSPSATQPENHAERSPGGTAATVTDAAILLQVIVGYDALDPDCVDVPVGDYLTQITAGVRGWRVAQLLVDDCDSGILDVVNNAARVFAELGAKLTQIDVPELSQAANANTAMLLADAAAFHRQRLTEHPEWFGADVRQRLEAGRALTAIEYSLARRTQTSPRHRRSSSLKASIGTAGMSLQHLTLRRVAPRRWQKREGTPALGRVGPSVPAAFAAIVSSLVISPARPRSSSRAARTMGSTSNGAGGRGNGRASIICWRDGAGLRQWRRCGPHRPGS